MKKLIVICVTLIILAATVTIAGAAEERTLWERVATLELQVVRLEQRIAALEACNPIVCTFSDTAPVLGLPVGIQGYSSPVRPSETISPTAETPVVTPEPSTTPEPTEPPTVEPPEPTEKEHCNQGVGNGGEGCDPGNSNHNHESNDEGKTNRGGQAKP